MKHFNYILKSKHHLLNTQAVILFALMILFFASTYAQTPLKQKAGSLTTANGPVYTPQVVTLYNGASAAMPNITVTYTLSNQQFGPSMPVRQLEGLPNDYGISFGGGSLTENFQIGSRARNAVINSVGNPLNNMFTACGTCIDGIDVATDYAVGLFTSSDALIIDDNSSITKGNNLEALDARIYYGDLTISFNRPVSNPVLQLVGLGGNFMNYVSSSRKTDYYVQGFSTEFDLASTEYTLSKLDGNDYLNVTPTQITNNASKIGAISQGSTESDYSETFKRYAATGSVKVNGTNIVSITLKVYLRGDGGNKSPASAPLDPLWAGDESAETVSGDAFLISTTLQAAVIVEGNVFNDPNAGNVNNSTGSANVIPNNIYASLVDDNGNVVESQLVATTGTYSFSSVWEGTYSVVISTAEGVQGSPAPSSVLPSGYVHTGDFNGTPNSGNTNITFGTSSPFLVSNANVSNINFAIERLPESFDQSYTINKPTVGQTLVLNSSGLTDSPGPLTGSDPEDYANPGGTLAGKTVNITSPPSNGTLYYDGAEIPVATSASTPFVINNYDPSKLTLVLTGSGYVEVIFEYAYVDLAAKADPTPATYKIDWSGALPVNLMSFYAINVEGNAILLSWETTEETNSEKFEIQHSLNAKVWSPIGSVLALGENRDLTTYSFTHTSPVSGENLYRLKMIDQDATFAYSRIQSVKFEDKEIKLILHPNPASDYIFLKDADGQTLSSDKVVELSIMNTKGEEVYKITSSVSSHGINMTGLAIGMYIIKITLADGSLSTHKLLIEK
ncbi:putative secreted protein (Por secretion system target) [Dyadobacter jejuensis]|uniref:Putative secreted protein (Por secretion system target) n=1 Tax=Dyadobacter jejuensis TaxID=1082580 RepID=A0A316AHB3_9BACT|nr:T9SS type A sorting domain-containing protein [Dyadobacter jejuensis]PWJ57093.1 putative secreted protein (Por secretion system target) [Dyadobacter jejuensis]